MTEHEGIARCRTTFDTRLGQLKVLWTKERLVRLCLPGSDKKRDLKGRPRPVNAVPDWLRRFSLELANYLAGEASSLDVPYQLPGGTDFQRRVWRACSGIPYGQTESYSTLAQKVGSPRAARAVGSALGRNPIPLIIPCHRVIRKDGGIGGFSADLKVKKFLLKLEGAQVDF